MLSFVSESFLKMRRRNAYGLLSVFGSLFTWLSLHLFTDFGNAWDVFAKPIRRVYIATFLLTVLDYIWTIFWWMVYEPVPTPVDARLFPSVTVVIPVYNESYFIRHALHSILQSSYPKDRLEVIVVDDGSTDDSWEHITATATAYANTSTSYRTIRHQHNLGKRSAIHSGFSIASGEVIVSLDSDSVLERDSISKLIAPLVLDSRVGGVAGHLSVLNVGQKTIPRLLDILFETSGNIPRAAQSQACGAVTILPGALSAYRTIAIKPLLAGLRETTFLGTPIKHGEDVEITHGLLHAGWRTVYQSNAVVHTLAPENATRAFLMYTRWERSSYIYLLSSFFHMTRSALIRQLGSQLFVKGGVQNKIAEHFHVDKIEKPERRQGDFHTADMPRTRTGCLFLLSNLTSTAVGNFVFPLALYSQVYTVISRPEMVFIGCITTILLSAFRSLLFLADSSDDVGKQGKREQEVEKELWGFNQRGLGMMCTDPNQKDDASIDFEVGKEEHYIFSRKARLSWRLQYGGLAILFHASFIGWTSVVALLTIRSQKWLTR